MVGESVVDGGGGGGAGVGGGGGGDDGSMHTGSFEPHLHVYSIVPSPFRYCIFVLNDICEPGNWSSHMFVQAVSSLGHRGATYSSKVT